MHLRHAAQRVGVLHARIADAVRFADGAARQQGPQELGGGRLTHLAASVLDAGVECGRRAEERLERRGAGDMRRVPERAGIAHGECGHRRVRLSAVDEREPFLGTEHDRCEPRLREQLRGGTAVSRRTMDEVALADERERQVSERSQVAARADAALLGHQRPEIRVEHGAEQFRQCGTGAGEPLREDVRTQQHHRAHFAPRQRHTHAGRMAAHEVHLQRRELVRRDRHVGELAEPRRHAIHDLVAGDDALHHTSRDGHSRACRRVQRHRGGVLGHGADLRDGEGAAVDRNRFCGHFREPLGNEVVV